MEGDDNSTNYSLYCSLCKFGYNCREEWNVHLVGDEHQCQARMGMMSWGQEEREAVLVAFTSVPVNRKGENLVKWIAGKNWRVIVTDFVWWGERPRVAFVKFESREVLEMVLKRCQGSLDGRRLHLKRASELHVMEWKGLLPEEGHDDEQNLDVPEPESRKSLELVLTGQGQLEGRQEDLQRASELSEPLAVQCNAENSEDSDSEVSLHEAPASSSGFTEIGFQFETMTKSFRVPEEEWTYIQKLLKYLNRAGKSFEPKFQLNVFRHSFLKLRLPSYPKHWLIRVSSTEYRFTVEKEKELCNRIRDQRKVTQVTDDKNQNTRIGTEFVCQENSHGFRFTVVTFPLSVLEAQLSKLTEYLFGFDQRCIPLLGLVYFWYSTNNLRICWYEAPDGNQKGIECVPLPATLEWMLLSFLGLKARIIPTARHILEKAHTPVYVLGNPEVDVGFDCDSDYLESWRNRKGGSPKEGTDAFFLSVVQLAQRFFEYFGKLLKRGQWILNTKDGEMLFMEQIVQVVGKKKPKSKCDASKLSAKEIRLVRQAQYNRSPQVNFNNTLFHVVHPLYLRWTLRVQNEEVRKMQILMETTGTRLKSWMECQRKKEKQEDLATVLKIE